MESKSTLTIILTIGLILVSLFAIYSYSNKQVLQQISQSERNTISVSGSSNLEAMPDQAEVYLRIETIDPSIGEAQDKNTAKANKVIELLKSKDVEVETINYNLEPFREWEKGKYVDKGYRASHTLKLTITDLEKVGLLIKLSINNGANNVDSVQFTLSKDKEKEVRSELLSKAASDARLKADLLADSLSVRIKGVISVSESSPYIRSYYSYEKTIGVESAAVEAPFIEPKSVSLTTTVNVVFEI